MSELEARSFLMSSDSRSLQQPHADVDMSTEATDVAMELDLDLSDLTSPCHDRPPTPAPSPTPDEFHATPSWGVAAAEEDFALRAVRNRFQTLKTDERQRFLAELLNMCTSYELASVSAFVSPRLMKDFLKYLPVELSLRVSLDNIPVDFSFEKTD